MVFLRCMTFHGRIPARAQSNARGFHLMSSSKFCLPLHTVSRPSPQPLSCRLRVHAPTCSEVHQTQVHLGTRSETHLEVRLRIQVVSHLLQAGIIHVSVLVLLIRLPVLQRVSVITVSYGFLFTRHSLQVCLLSLKHCSLSK
jgi:hypothetical protein